MQRVNLLPKDLQRRRFLIDRARLWGIIAGSALLWTLAANWTLSTRVERLQQVVDSAEDVGAALERAKLDIAAIRQQREHVRVKHDALHAVVAESRWADVASEIANLSGEGLWFRECVFERVDGVTGGSGDGDTGGPTSMVRLRIAGYALSNAEFSRFVSRLSGSSRVTQVEPNESRLEPLGQGRLVAFSVSCQVLPESDETDVRVMIDAEVDDVMAALGGRIGPSSITELMR